MNASYAHTFDNMAIMTNIRKFYFLFKYVNVLIDSYKLAVKINVAVNQH